MVPANHGVFQFQGGNFLHYFLDFASIPNFICPPYSPRCYRNIIKCKAEGLNCQHHCWGLVIVRAPRSQGTRGPRDQRTQGPKDQRTKGPDNHGTRGPRDQGTGPEDQGTRGPRDHGTGGPRDRGTKGAGDQTVVVVGLLNRKALWQHL